MAPGNTVPICRRGSKAAYRSPCGAVLPGGLPKSAARDRAIQLASHSATLHTMRPVCHRSILMHSAASWIRSACALVIWPPCGGKLRSVIGWPNSPQRWKTDSKPAHNPPATLKRREACRTGWILSMKRLLGTLLAGSILLILAARSNLGQGRRPFVHRFVEGMAHLRPRSWRHALLTPHGNHARECRSAQGGVGLSHEACRVHRASRPAW